MTMTEEHHERPTTASIDRRVERLELAQERLGVAQAETDRKVDQLDAKVEYIKEFMSLRFTGLENSLATSVARFDAFTSKIEALIVKGMEQQADLDASPLGRSINRRIGELEGLAERLVEPTELRGKLADIQAQLDTHDSALDQLRGAGAGFRLFVLPVIGSAAAVVGILAALGKL